MCIYTGAQPTSLQTEIDHQDEQRRLEAAAASPPDPLGRDSEGGCSRAPPAAASAINLISGYEEASPTPGAAHAPSAAAAASASSSCSRPQAAGSSEDHVRSSGPQAAGSSGFRFPLWRAPHEGPGHPPNASNAPTGAWEVVEMGARPPSAAGSSIGAMGRAKRAAPAAVKRFQPPSFGDNKRKRAKLCHDDECFECGDGGDLLECTVCPRTYHLECVGLSDVPVGSWHCPWHSCIECERKSSNVGGQLCAHSVVGPPPCPLRSASLTAGPCTQQLPCTLHPGCGWSLRPAPLHRAAAKPQARDGPMHPAPCALHPAPCTPSP